MATRTRTRDNVNPMQARREAMNRLRGNTRQSIIDAKNRVGKKILDLSEVSVNFFKYKKWEKDREYNLIDIVPFVVTQDWYKNLKTPAGTIKGVNVGEVDWYMELPVHKKTGPQQIDIVCNRLAFGQDCERCKQYFAENEKKELNSKIISMMKARWISYYNLIDLNTNPNEILLWEISSYCFNWNLLKEMELPVKGNSEDDDDFGEIIPFFETNEDGRSLKFKMKETSFDSKPGATKKDKPFFSSGDIEFIKREQAYDDSIIDQAYSLDKFVKIYTPEEVEEMCLTGSSSVDNKEEKQESSQGFPRKTITQVKEQLEEQKDKPPFEIVDPPKETDTDNKCPNGHKFGEDADDHDDCQTCPENLWNECGNLREQREKGKSN